jgi:hypothetical protein
VNAVKEPKGPRLFTPRHLPKRDPRTVALHLLSRLCCSHPSPPLSLSVRVGDVIGTLSIETVTSQTRPRAAHKKLLAALTAKPISSKRIAAIAGLQPGAYVRTALAELVRLGLALHSPDGYFLATCRAADPHRESPDQKPDPQFIEQCLIDALGEGPASNLAALAARAGFDVDGDFEKLLLRLCRRGLVEKDGAAYRLP